MDTWLDILKTASKKVVHKTIEVLSKKTADAVAEPYNDKIVKTKPGTKGNPRKVEEIIILQEQREEKLNNLKQVL